VSSQADALVSIVLASEDPPEHVGQFLFQARPIVTGIAAPTNASAPLDSPLRVSYAEQAEEYCFHVEAIDIVTATVAPYPDLAPACVAHGDLGDIGLVQQDLAVLGLLDAARCELPPFGFEDAWCGVNEETCAEEDAPRACRSFGYVCEGGTPPADMSPLDLSVAGSPEKAPPPMGARGGAGGAGGQAAADSDEDRAGSGGEEAQAGMGGGGSDGCSVRASSGRSSTGMAGWLSLLASTLGVLSVRRRTRAAR
jgi:hypothetical protein